MFRLFVEKPELYNEWRLVWGGTWSQPILWGAAFLLVVAVFLSVQSQTRLTSWKQKLALFLSRSFAAVVLWFLLAGPALEFRHVQTVRNHLPIFLDTSASMRIRDFGESPSRIDQVKLFLQRNQALFQKLQEEQKVDWFTFDREIRPFAGEPKALQADGDQTSVFSLLPFLKERYQDKPLAGVVLVTDGVDTQDTAGASVTQKQAAAEIKTQADRRLRDFTQALRSLGVPVHVVAPRANPKLKDIAVTEIYGDAFAFLHNKFTLEAMIRVQGYPSGEIPVSLYQDGQLVKTSVLQIQDGRQDYLVAFELLPRRAGKFVFSVRVPLEKDEAIAENNEKDFLLKIIRDRIRVLQVTGRPSWDVRFLRRLLKQNASVDLISFFILRTMENISQDRTPNHELSLIQFPSEELFTKSIHTFDLVIFQNFNFGPYLPSRYLRNVARFVHEGGAFVMVGGDLSFGSGGYLGSPLETEGILPFRLGIGGVDEKPFRPALTETGEDHPITRLSPDPVQNKRLWSEMPLMPGSNLVGELLPGASALLKHPRLQTDGGGAMPTLAVKETEKGRVMGLTIDGSWRWNFETVLQGGTREAYYRFWNQAIRWLIRDPELERIRITSLRSAYRQGEEARFRIRVLDAQYKAIREGKISLIVEEALSRRRLFQGEQTLPSDGDLLFGWKAERSGIYRLRVTYQDGSSRPPTGEELFEVRGLLDEFQEIQPKTSLFQAIQKATQGSLIHLDASLSSLPFRPPTVIRVDRSQTADLWDHTVVFFLLLFLLSFEWFFRRLWGLP